MATQPIADGWTPVDESGWSTVTAAPAAPSAPSIGEGATSISAPPEPATPWERAAGWFKSIQQDLKYGGGTTLPGRAYAAAGGQPVYNGTSPGAADTVASLPLGGLKAAQGNMEMFAGHPWEGTKDMISGTLQASTIPGSFIAPEAAPRGAQMLEDAVAAFPTKGKAQALFNGVSNAIGDVPVRGTAPARTTAIQAKGFANTGAQMPKVLSDFLARTEEGPLNPALSFDEGRNFYSNATGMSAADKMATNPSMHRYIGQFTGDLGEALHNVAGAHGQGAQYEQAMQMWQRVKRLEEFVDNAKKVGKYAGWGAAATYGGSQIHNVRRLLDY
jgi:hypothetical protein